MEQLIHNLNFVSSNSIVIDRNLNESVPNAVIDQNLPEVTRFSLNNFTEMKNRGLKNILIACGNNLSGRSEAIGAVYPKTEHQLCIVHQIRNSI